MSFNNNKGFTLMELLVVVAVLGALVGIAIPQYSAYRSKADIAGIISDSRSVYRAFTVYFIEDPDGAEGYPMADPASAVPFNNSTFFPLTARADGLNFTDIDISSLLTKIQGGQADGYDSPDDMGLNQEFYVVLTLASDPTKQVIISNSNDIFANGFGGGALLTNEWLDGVFVMKDGVLAH